MMKIQWLSFAGCLGVVASIAAAKVTLPPMFSDHMVIQAGRPVPVWGTAEANEHVSVSIAGQTQKATAGANGKWQMTLDPLAESKEPLTMKIDASNSITIQDVLVGEVWLCAGQSNMALPVAKTQNAEQEQAAAKWPQIRMLEAKWVVCSPETVSKFSATAYYFGRDIHQKTGAPVGLLNRSAGGTPIELWTSIKAQKEVPELKPLLVAADGKQAESTEAAAQAESDRQQAVEVEGKKATNAAKVKPGYLFENRIVPLAPYAIRGVIWYQGEANSYTTHANLYGTQLITMIKDWRGRWGYEFAFISVQLPELGKPQSEPFEPSGRVLVREGVLQSLSLPSTGMAVTLGTGEANNNHPKNKQEVGRRLALWALANVYKQSGVAASGPLPERCKIAGEKIIVSFSHTDQGLVAKGGGELKGFAVAGSDGKWYTAQAKIVGNTVELTHPQVKTPTVACYAWSTNPQTSNLCNGAGLPAAPFRTDGPPLLQSH